jgi:septal ring factor EnvC (AmiA/AmiB activator)
MEALPPWLIDLVKVVGTSAIILIIWLITHRSSERRFDKFMEQLDIERKSHINQIEKEREAATIERKAFSAEFVEIRKQSHENNRLMTELLRTQTQILAKMEPELENNTKLLHDHSVELALMNQNINHLQRSITK